MSCKVLNEKTEMSLKQSLKVGRILHKAIFFFFNFPFPILSSLNSVACQVVMYSSKLLLHSVPVSTMHLLKVANGVLESSHKKKTELTNTSSGKNYLSLINHCPLKTVKQKHSYILHTHTITHKVTEEQSAGFI